MSTTQIMVDIEGRSTSPRAAILQVAAVVVGQKPTHGHTFDMCVDPRDGVRFGEVDPETDKWWHAQHPEVVNKVWTGNYTLQETMEMFAAWIKCFEYPQIWARGPQYDICALEYAFEQLEMNVPWRYNQIYDLRTLTAMVPVGDPGLLPNQAHDAFEDAKYQAEQLIAVQKRMKSWPTY